MLVRVTTDLSIPAEAACELAQKAALFRYVVWPLFTIGALPEHFDVGDQLAARLSFLGVIPAWKHHLRLVSIAPHEIYTNERGGPMRIWNHRLTFEPTSERSCRYTDEIEIDAGPATLPSFLFVHLMFRWRQRRWRTLTRVLAD